MIELTNEKENKLTKKLMNVVTGHNFAPMNQYFARKH
jgi:hypothetical protein